MSTTSSSVVPKIIVVVGTTGVGKTKLGVDLAQHFSGEVINADVMQMYKGLQVATAKVTEEERQGVPHHLMSFLEPHETFSPHEFRKLADEKIQEISARGNLPIVVGGTMYYVQGLLWDHLIGHGVGPVRCLAVVLFVLCDHRGVHKEQKLFGLAVRFGIGAQGSTNLLRNHFDGDGEGGQVLEKRILHHGFFDVTAKKLKIRKGLPLDQVHG